MKKEKIEITLSWKQAEAISRFYSFPTAVFLYDEKTMLEQLKGTRQTNIFDRIEKIREKLKEMAEEI